MLHNEIVINITRENIKNGLPTYGESCAISKAICRKYKKGASYLNVHTSDECVVINGRTYVPANARERNKMVRFIDNFDNDSRRRFCRPMALRLKLEQ